MLFIFLFFKFKFKFKFNVFRIIPLHGLVYHYNDYFKALSIVITILMQIYYEGEPSIDKNCLQSRPQSRAPSTERTVKHHQAYALIREKLKNVAQ